MNFYFGLACGAVVMLLGLTLLGWASTRSERKESAGRRKADAVVQIEKQIQRIAAKDYIYDGHEKELVRELAKCIALLIK